MQAQQLFAQLKLEKNVIGPFLWLLDENFTADTVNTLALTNTDTVLSNRWELANALNGKCQSIFSDFNLSEVEHSGTSHLLHQSIFYRISKERPLTNHILNQSAQYLPIGGKLVLVGAKDEGIKGYVQKAQKQLGFSGELKKHASLYTATLTKQAPHTALLDTKNYTELREFSSDEFGSYYSKPGVYGWNKIDQGSRVLREQLFLLCRDSPQLQKNCAIDLGCGYGFLSVALAKAGFREIIATDNNAAALHATEKTLTGNGLQHYNIFAGDAGNNIDSKADLVICNPPFHQGFSTDSALTLKFIHAAERLCAARGMALFVVNAFIPLEKVARPLFKKVELLVNTGQFKVLKLSN